LSESDLDAIYLKYLDPIALEYCPPAHIRKIVQGKESLYGYAATSSEYTAYLKIFCGLKPYHKVLEIGCGCGRIATALKYYLKEPGSFYGMDVVQELIYHANKLLNSPQFNFLHINLYSEYYNPDPKATKAEKLTFPYEENFF